MYIWSSLRCGQLAPSAKVSKTVNSTLHHLASYLDGEALTTLHHLASYLDGEALINCMGYNPRVTCSQIMYVKCYDYI